MAAGVLPKPGTKLGPCKTTCTHRDCAQTKADAAASCRFCEKAIGYGRAFYRSQKTGALAHAFCLDEGVEKGDTRADEFCS